MIDDEIRERHTCAYCGTVKPVASLARWCESKHEADDTTT